MNQCRSCHPTCYKCTDRFDNNCIACTGDLYLNPSFKTCVDNCESWGLTKSISEKNLCVEFDATAVLVNVNTITPINTYNFTHLQANVTQATSPTYDTLWEFDFENTKLVNQNKTTPQLTLNATGPFTSDLKSLKVNLDPTFFQLGFKYVFILKIIRNNQNSRVEVARNWTLIMNDSPQKGYVSVTPIIGLRNTTTFVLRCVGWSDDNTADILYRFYSQENNTSVFNYLTNWTDFNEAYTNFTVRYYQLPTTGIKIFCDVKDKYNATNTASTDVYIYI